MYTHRQYYNYYYIIYIDIDRFEPIARVFVREQDALLLETFHNTTSEQEHLDV